jgi:hypothetical protein
VLTESANPQVYWRVLKKRLSTEGNETVTNCNALKMESPDGKMRLTDVANTQQLLRLIQSPVSEFQKALGQYDNYLLSLEELEPDRQIWLAVPEEVWNDFFQRPFVQKVIRVRGIRCIVFDPDTQIIVKWIK